jgi:hypothetical protein
LPAPFPVIRQILCSRMTLPDQFLSDGQRMTRIFQFKDMRPFCSGGMNIA